MKPSDKPQISKKWWASEKPGDIKGVELEKALVSAEKALAEEKKKKGDGPAIKEAQAALEELESAVDKTIKKECDKKKHKDVITVLDKFFALIKDENSRLEKLLEEAGEEGDEEGDEEESEGKIFEKDYLHKMIKLLKSTGKELNFGFGLDTKNPEGSTLLLTRKGKPERLFKALKKTGDFTNRLITYGKALPDPDNGKVLVFKLAESAGEPPQVLKLGRRFLRADKGLKFRKLRLILPGGQTFNDTEPDPEETNGAPTQGDLSQELGKVQGLDSAWQEALKDVKAQIDKLVKAVNQQNDTTMSDIVDGLRELVGEFPDLDLSKLVAAAKANDRAAYDQTLKQTTNEIKEVRNLMGMAPLLKTIDQNPYVTTNVYASISSIVDRVSKELDV